MAMVVHEIVSAIQAEESIYNTVEDPAIQDASCIGCKHCRHNYPQPSERREAR